MYGLRIGPNSLSSLLFRTDRPYSFCRICGEVFQRDIDRNPVEFANAEEGITLMDIVLLSDDQRNDWGKKHAVKHTEWQKAELNGAWLTYSAAYRLAAFGILFTELEGS